jgi:hypothetical protein
MKSKSIFIEIKIISQGKKPVRKRSGRAAIIFVV